MATDLISRRPAGTPSAQISWWAFVKYHPPEQEPTLHLVGRIHRHPDYRGGQPYVSSPLQALDLPAKRVITRSGRIIELVKGKLEECGMTLELLRTIAGAPVAWGLPKDTRWEFVQGEEL